MNRPFVGVIAVVVIIASLVSIFLTQRRPTAPINLLPFEGCGLAGAAETAKLLNGRGRILVVTFKRVEPVEAATKAFTKELAKHPGIQIVATEALELSDASPNDSEGVRGELYFQWLSKYPGLDAIVSFVGSPSFKEEELRRLPKQRPRLVVLQGYGATLRDLLLDGIVDLAVAPNVQPPTESQQDQAQPKSALDWFHRYYTFATPENAEQLPAF
ncbi:MAG: hypothetical protein N3A53_04610 [Verrucomicrobiae bacterium]|nr:hypothetical protein [Verrucomicrobiae bacterium]